MFDQIYLMAEGHCIYCGPRESLVPFISDSVNLVCPSDHNPADFGIQKKLFTVETDNQLLYILSY